jgi:hypothetical protein
MSKEVIYFMLHTEVLRLLEEMGQRRLALEVERAGMSHDIYDFLDKAFSMYYAEYGGVNCRWLRDAIRQDWERVTRVVLPQLLRQYAAGVAPRTTARGEAAGERLLRIRSASS